MTRILSACLLAGIVFLAAEVPSLRAQTSPAQAVEEREDIMKSLWRGYYRDMFQASRGESTDLQAVAVKATQATDALKKFGTLFPPGSGREAFPDTRAKPEIWTQRAEFDAALTALINDTNAFGAIAKSGASADALKASYAKVAESCGACHGGPGKSGGKFRFEEN